MIKLSFKSGKVLLFAEGLFASPPLADRNDRLRHSAPRIDSFAALAMTNKFNIPIEPLTKFLTAGKVYEPSSGFSTLTGWKKLTFTIHKIHDGYQEQHT